MNVDTKKGDGWEKVVGNCTSMSKELYWISPQVKDHHEMFVIKIGHSVYYIATVNVFEA